jgi:hypothetical protein
MAPVLIYMAQASNAQARMDMTNLDFPAAGFNLGIADECSCRTVRANVL